jgi:phospho-N-acetylmuramoyl-pentapeptide-transferase
VTLLTRVILAAVVSLVVVLAIGPFFIPLLQRLKFGQEVRSDGPRTHLKKQGTATMGGVMILLTAGISGFLFTTNPWETMFLFLIMLGCGLLGLWDDFLIVVLRRPLGLRARAKILGQLLIGILLAWGAYLLYGLNSSSIKNRSNNCVKRILQGLGPSPSPSVFTPRGILQPI